MVFKATFNYITAISWRSVLLVEETGLPGENHSPYLYIYIFSNMLADIKCFYLQGVSLSWWYGEWFSPGSPVSSTNKKGKSESVNRTRTEDTMAKTKEKHKEQTTIYKTLHRKQDRITRTPLQTGGEFRFSELTCLTNFNTDILLPRHRDLLMMPHKKKISFVVTF
jgi:hypothetical protein